MKKSSTEHMAIAIATALALTQVTYGQVPDEPVDLAPTEITYTSVGGGLFDVQVTIDIAYAGDLADATAAVELFVDDELVGSANIDVGFVVAGTNCPGSVPPCPSDRTCNPESWECYTYYVNGLPTHCACRKPSFAVNFSNIALAGASWLEARVDPLNEIEEWDETNNEFAVAITVIPTVSEWGLIIMTLLLLTAGTIVFARRRRPAYLEL